MNTVKYTLLAIIAVMCLACGRSSEQAPAPDRTPVVQMETHFIIGLDDQPDEYLLGRPVAVRVDSTGTMFIADRASNEIKVFDRNGKFLRTIGGRGRGPGELLGIEFLHWTPDGHLVVMDRGNFLYTIITTEGDHISSYPYNFSQQFHPRSIVYGDGYLIGLMMLDDDIPELSRFDRPMFFLYTTDFQNRLDSFGIFSEDIDLVDLFPHSLMAFHPGSIHMNDSGNTIRFSPGTYHGKVYVYRKNENEIWNLAEILKGVDPGVKLYKMYYNKDEYNRDRERDVPGVIRIRGMGDESMGRIMARDGGIFATSSGKTIQFFSVWAEDLIDITNVVPFKDLFIQVFDEQGELYISGYVTTYEERNNLPIYPVVSSMDSEGNFYMIEYMNEVPVVRKFSLEFPFIE